jgi:hypothetical protein
VSIVDDHNKVMEVVVEDKQLSLAIGEGQNVRLGAKLTGWRIDIKSEEEKRREIEAQVETLTAAGEARKPGNRKARRTRQSKPTQSRARQSRTRRSRPRTPTTRPCRPKRARRPREARKARPRKCRPRRQPPSPRPRASRRRVTRVATSLR